MRYPKNNFSVIYPNFYNLVTVIFLCITFSSIFSCSITLAVNHSNVIVKNTNVHKFQPLKQSVRSDVLAESTWSKPFRRIGHAINAKRIRRKSWSSSEKNQDAGGHDKGTNFQDHFPPNLHQSSDEQQELTRRPFYLLLAQEEAKCLEEFGELEPAASFEFPQDLFRPFVCLAGSRNYSACNQCIQITRARNVATKHFPVGNCQHICHVKSALPNCTHKCAEIVKSLINGMNNFRNGTDPGSGEWNVKGGCDQRVCGLKLTANEANRRGGAIDTNTLTTNVFCESVTQHVPKAQTTASSTSTAVVESQHKETNAHHFIYLKSLFIHAGNGTDAERQAPMVFVIEQREFQVAGGGLNRDLKMNWTRWRVLGKSPYGFDKIKVAYRQKTYEWRVTAVGIHGPVAVSIVNSFDTLDGYMEPGPPRGVFVMETKPKESTVDVLLGWDPPQERACFYKIVLETRHGEESARTVRIKGEPLGVHKIWFRDLKFDSTYSVRVTSRSAEWEEDESTHASLSFKTPTCLHSHQFRFDKCAPPSPRNLSYKVRPVTTFKVLDVLGGRKAALKRNYTAHLKWEPPAHANGTNLIEKYVVDVRAFSWNFRSSNTNGSKRTHTRLQFADPHDLLAPVQLNLSGNVTHVDVHDLDEAVEYTVLVSAVSSKGSSPPATITVKLQAGAGKRFWNTPIGLWVYPCGVLVTVLVIAFGFHAVKRISRRRQIKADRDSYFQSIDQRNAFTEDWSVISLTEHPNSTLKMLAQNSLPKDKWHVCFQDLKVGDIIGQGAFGVVRKAKMRTDKYLELQKRHNRRANCGVCRAKLGNGEEPMETVALKMLRVAPTNADNDNLMKEIKTMQSLGTHSQIVTLLGVCTSPTSMCLVLEYCPGGDLLSFLRKFREKYLPLLNLESGSVKERRCEDLEYKSYSNEGKIMSRQSDGSGSDYQEVCYTALDHKQPSASSRELSDENQTIWEQVTETETSAEVSDDRSECKSISEKDVLSYARQTALGMAYLERNHIIHRDLACRNILVLGDYKRVKISDFGLSRDIYTWNVYQQNTEGKLPLKWMALESITSRVFTSKSDVWSYGIVLWELVTLGAVPYPALENQQLFKMLRSGYRMERPDNCSEELYALMRKCWRAPPADRPNFLELILYLETMMDTEPEFYLTLQP